MFTIRLTTFFLLFLFISYYSFVLLILNLHRRVVFILLYCPLFLHFLLTPLPILLPLPPSSVRLTECYYEEGADLCRNQSLFFYNQSCLTLKDFCGLADLLPLNETHCRNAANTSLMSTEKVVTKISDSEDFFRYSTAVL